MLDHRHSERDPEGTHYATLDCMLDRRIHQTPTSTQYLPTDPEILKRARESDTKPIKNI